MLVKKPQRSVSLVVLVAGLFMFLSSSVHSFLSSKLPTIQSRRLSLMAASTTTTLPTWGDLTSLVGTTPVGTALNKEVIKRKEGTGAAHVSNTLRKFDATEDPEIILYRDSAAW
jgi:hypothetical protein